MPSEIGSPGSNFGNWLNSGGWYLVILLLLGVLLSFGLSRSGFSRRREQEREAETAVGRKLAIAGALFTLIGAALPWTSGAFGVTANGIDGIFVYVFGLLWLPFHPVSRKVHAILGVGWGGLALLLALQSVAFFSALGVTLEYGVYVSILGSLSLIVGSALVYVQARKALGPESIPPQEVA